MFSLLVEDTCQVAYWAVFEPVSPGNNPTVFIITLSSVNFGFGLNQFLCFAFFSFFFANLLHNLSLYLSLAAWVKVIDNLLSPLLDPQVGEEEGGVKKGQEADEGLSLSCSSSKG